ncbi:MAG: tetratricopeptide repeat-containing protein [Planctomycetes bacterium]|nr:tetratricopeptide repeat-containing protein [Planctomycetota bacterium]
MILLERLTVHDLGTLRRVELSIQPDGKHLVAAGRADARSLRRALVLALYGLEAAGTGGYAGAALELALVADGRPFVIRRDFDGERHEQAVLLGGGARAPREIRGVAPVRRALQSLIGLDAQAFTNLVHPNGRAQALGEDHPATLTSVVNTGWVHWARGEPAKAEPFYRQTLKGRRRVLGKEHPNTLRVLGQLASLLVEQRKYAEAETHRREALEVNRRVHGADHPDTLSSTYDMGELFSSMGKFVEAEPYYRKALEGRRRVLGADDRQTLTSIHQMGWVLKSMGKLNEAEPYTREAMDGRCRVLGDDHAHSLLSMTNMGDLLSAMGKFEEAVPYYRKALAARRRVLGDDHPDTLISINNMGGLLHSQGKYSEVEPYWREALERNHRVLGNDHPDTLRSINNMGYLLNALGKHEDAFDVLRAGESAARRTWTGADSRWLGNYLAKLGDAEGATSRFSQGEATLLEAHQLLAAGFGEDHERTTKCVTRFATLYESWHAAEPGRGYDAKAAEWRAKLPKTHEAEPAKP